MKLDAVIEIARQAGRKIMHIYGQDFAIEQKQDESPVTAADKAAHHVIMEELTKLDREIPILSEEGSEIPYGVRVTWNRFWLVDPLDGTKEFIKRNGEFTVNIAFIEHGYPILGVVYAPATDVVYAGSTEEAFKLDSNNVRTELQVIPATPEEAVTIVESRSHPSKELEEWMQSLNDKYKQVQRIQRGSSLKLCAVAEGLAHFYPRFGPTMEWDTAAGQAVVEAAGGQVTTLDGERLSYNKESLLNPYFIVKGL